MTVRNDLQGWVTESLRELGGTGSIVQVAKLIWKNHHKELEVSGNLFFTWQYDMRWACTKLREEGIILPSSLSKKGEWRLS